MINNGYDLKRNFENHDLINNAWYLAIKNGQVNQIGFFLNWGGQMKNNPYELPIIADVNQIFLYKNKSTWTPVLIAIEFYKEHRQKPHVGHGASLGTLIHYGRTNLNQKAKPILNKKDQTPISFTLIKSQSDYVIRGILEILVNNTADLREGFQIYIQSGGNVDHIIGNRQSTYLTLLGWAVYFKKLDAVRFLVSAGAKINEPIKWGYFIGKEGKYAHKVLELALQYEDTSIAEYLMEHGAEL